MKEKDDKIKKSRSKRRAPVMRTEDKSKNFLLIIVYRL